MIRAFWLGLRECWDEMGMTYDDDPESPRSRAYDLGRDWGRRLLPVRIVRWWSRRKL